MFLSLLEESGVPGSQVEIELTESIAIENINMLSDRLQKLQKADIYLAMDDFGTGYSSLSVLQNLKLNRLKIDRSFVSGECASSNSRSEEHTSELQSRPHLVCRLLLEKKNTYWIVGNYP